MATKTYYFQDLNLMFSLNMVTFDNLHRSSLSQYYYQHHVGTMLVDALVQRNRRLSKSLMKIAPCVPPTQAY